MKRMLMISVVVALALVVQPAWGTTLPMSVVGAASIEGTVAAGPLSTPMTVSGLNATIVSEAYNGIGSALGQYVYTYQLTNTGTTDAIVSVSLYPYTGATASTVVGYFTQVDGQLIPDSAGVSLTPTINFNFTSANIGPGLSSVVLYVVNPNAPGLISADTIDGGTAHGTVIGPVPEPVTMFSAFMAISGLGMYIRKRTKVQA